MDKLIELLKLKDGYEHIIGKKQSDGGYMFWLDDIAYREERILGKKFGFIKWLVENDKLKDNGIKPRKDLVKEIQIVDYETGKVLGWKNQYSETEQLIMYLSIQDNPIEFLISILKIS